MKYGTKITNISKQISLFGALLHSRSIESLKSKKTPDTKLILVQFSMEKKSSSETRVKNALQITDVTFY